MNYINLISEELNISLNRIKRAIELFDDGNTIAFIARYRKEVTESLEDKDLREIYKKLIAYRSVEERANTILKSLDEQDVLTDALKSEVLNATKLSTLEDIYRPYKPKRKTRASIAIAQGLKPLATLILKQEKVDDFLAYVDTFVTEEKEVLNREEALKKALDIIAEEISDKTSYRAFIKRYIFNNGLIHSQEIAKDEKDTFNMYKDYKENIKSIQNHRVLAISRGEKLKLLKVKLEYKTTYIEDRIFNDINKNNLYIEYIKEAINDSLNRLILPSVDNEIRNELFSTSEDASILVFEENLIRLLMYPPIKDKVVMGFDPGFRTGCKCAIVDKNGKYLYTDVFYITLSQSNIDREVKRIKEALIKYKVDYIALGNGTASRESEEVLSRLIRDNSLNVKLTIVNESGASVYSASKLGIEEFKELSVEKRSAISLARRLQDPLAELVKIDPKAMGVGQYQHDMNQKKLDLALSNVVSSCVNSVGVNLNNASKELLSYVSGVTNEIAKNIIVYRDENNGFTSRNELKKVKKLGPKAFVQCAGFLRIDSAKNPFDNTSIHPESYKLAEKILECCNFKPIDIKNKEVQAKIEELYKTDYFKNNLDEYNDTIIDIIKELIKPGRDIREDAIIYELDNNVKDIKDLKVGMVLNGVVHNICDFGAFIDINVHQDGLCHISQIANKFIKHPLDVLTINQVVKVKVIGVDIERKKISLSIKDVK